MRAALLDVAGERDTEPEVPPVAGNPVVREEEDADDGVDDKAEVLAVRPGDILVRLTITTILICRRRDQHP